MESHEGTLTLPLVQRNRRHVAPASTTQPSTSRHQPDQASEPELDPQSGRIAWWFMAVLSVITFPLSLLFFVQIFLVKDYERVAIFRLGHLLKGDTRGPGIVFVFRCIETSVLVDMRSVAVDVRPQNVLTSDHVTVRVDGVVCYKVIDTKKACFMGNVRYSTALKAQTELRALLGKFTLTQILAKRDEISKTLKRSLCRKVKHWGVEVENVEIKSLRLPDDMQRSMAAEAEASRRSKAKVILAEAEQKASVALKEASEIISQSPMALQLRRLQTMATISKHQDTTILFPFPVHVLPGVRGSWIDASKF